MGKNAFLAVLLVFLIVADVSDASLHRILERLLGAAPKDHASSPSPSPFPGGKKSDPKPTDGSKNNEPEPPVPNKSTKLGPKDHPSDNSNQTGGLIAASTENCDESLDKNCKDKGTMTACVKAVQSGSKKLVVLVHNGGESTLKVNLTVENQSANEQLEVPKNQTEKISITLSNDNSTKIILYAGTGECVLHWDPPVKRNFYVGLPPYDKLVTPVNGAYFLILTALVFGGTWACCKFRKKRHPDGVPYQELEMGLPESVIATNVETAEGWDQGWDEDWDEDNAVKSPGRLVGSISANGLTSRTSNREGWESDWND
ncbi:uncharacterized protein LOC133872203 isoform X2 [Alnus glutinosa]|uniref:uncharacterized protein LOC133872203 isoform X2 n=1 Tax=Alnus glutinosa TaxID=3517 RepID=UPI002D773FD1|nr:uncharacterized protein LOC133872203 isoform X2 [Alnus glutinosa]